MRIFITCLVLIGFVPSLSAAPLSREISDQAYRFCTGKEPAKSLVFSGVQKNLVSKEVRECIKEEKARITALSERHPTAFQLKEISEAIQIAEDEDRKQAELKAQQERKRREAEERIAREKREAEERERQKLEQQQIDQAWNNAMLAADEFLETPYWCTSLGMPSRADEVKFDAIWNVKKKPAVERFQLLGKEFEACKLAPCNFRCWVLKGVFAESEAETDDPNSFGSTVLTVYQGKVEDTEAARQRLMAEWDRAAGASGFPLVDGVGQALFGDQALAAFEEANAAQPAERPATSTAATPRSDLLSKIFSPLHPEVLLIFPLLWILIYFLSFSNLRTYLPRDREFRKELEALEAYPAQLEKAGAAVTTAEKVFDEVKEHSEKKQSELAREDEDLRQRKGEYEQQLKAVEKELSDAGHSASLIQRVVTLLYKPQEKIARSPAQPKDIGHRLLRTERDKEATLEPETVNLKDGLGIVVTSGGSRHSQKVKVIQIIRRMTGLGLKASKALVDSAPSTIISSGLSMEEATAWKNEIDAAGGLAEIVES